MSAPPSPSGSETPTLGFSIEDFWDALGDSPASSAAETAASWLQSLQAGGEMPTPEQLVGLLTALLQERAMPALALPNGAAALVAVNAIDAILLQDNPPGGKRFPHRVEMLTDEDDLWAVCKSKFVHIVVRLVNGQGESIDGSTLQQGGLQLELTLVNANNRATLHHNPKKPNEALFQGVAGGSYEPKVVLMESRHEFRFQIMLLSSDLGGAIHQANIQIRVAPTRPDLAANANLCFTTRAFVSRAREPDPPGKAAGKRKAPADPEEAVFRSLGGDDGSVDDDEDTDPQYVSLSVEPQGLELEEEQDEVSRAPPSARVQNAEARARLQGMLDALESRQPLPSGPELVEALRMCRIGA